MISRISEIRRVLGLAVVVALMAVISAPVQASGVEIQEWQVPWEKTRPRDPYVAPNGLVWFCGQTGHYLASFDPDSGEFKRYELDDPTGPHNLIVADDGGVWYAGNLAAHIGRLDPETGEIVKYPMPLEAARDPHTLVFDHAGDIWFTAQQSSFVGKLEVKSGEISLIEVAGERARPYGIIIDPQDRPWFVQFGRNRLAMIEREGMTLREFDLPRAGARPCRLQATFQPSGATSRAKEFAKAAAPLVSTRQPSAAATPFQPRCGSRTDVGRARQLPGTTPSPGVPGLSALPSHSIWSPRQIASNGRPASVARSTARSRPRRRSSRKPAPKCPTPGSTT